MGRSVGMLALLVLAIKLSGDPPDGMEQRIGALLARMTLDEKIGQMSQSTSMATPSQSP